MRWTLFLTGVLVLILFSVSALASSDIVVTPITNQISVVEEASFKLKITNNAVNSQSYTIYSLTSGQGWSVDPYPLSDKVIENIIPGNSYETTIRVRPLEDFSPGIYYVRVSIEGDQGESYTESLKMYLRPENPLDYLPSIKATLDMNDKINPTEPVSIKLFLENKNPLDLTDLKIEVQSEMPEFNKEVTVSLPPLERKTVEFSVEPNPYQQPKEYVLFFVFQRDGQTVKVLEQKIEIISLMPPFAQDLTEEKVFLKKFYAATIKNEGNVRNTQLVKVPVTFWQSLFTSSGEARTVVEDEQRYIAWELSLGPNESTTYYFTTNYRIWVYALVIVLLFALFYWIVRSSLIITKKAVTTKGNDESSLSELKITLEVRNRTKRTVREVEVTDLVPGIANVQKSLELGTLKPKEIKHSLQGTRVVWALAELEGHEHRLITYKIKAKLNILGTFSLPRAVVKYGKKKGKHGKAYSNIFRLGG